MLRKHPLRILSVLCLLVAAVACTGTSRHPDASSKTGRVPATEAAPDALDDVSASGHEEDVGSVPDAIAAVPRPEIELDEELLYKFLLAEIAGHQGMLESAVSGYQELMRVTRDPKVAERATRVALYAEDDEGAEQAAMLWAELDPSNPASHQVQAVMSMRNRELKQAVEHLHMAMENMSGPPEQKLWVFANLLRGEDRDAALQVMERLAENYLDNADVLFAFAQQLAALFDELDRALELLQRVLTLRPGNDTASIAYLSLLENSLREGGKDGDEVLDWIGKALADDPDSFPLRHGRAQLLTRLLRYDEALAELMSLAAQQPDNERLHLSLGLLHSNMNNMQQAEQWFLRLREGTRHVDTANYHLGRIAEHRGKLEQAAEWYRGVQAKTGRHLDAASRLSVVQAKQGEVDEALRKIRGLAWRGPEERLILVHAEAEILTEAKRLGEAMVLFDGAIEELPNEGLLYARALLAEKLGRMDILERDLRALLEDDPNNATVLNALGYSLADNTDRYDEAYELIQRALALSPNDFHILDSMGWVLYRLGQLDEAVRYLQQALNKRNDPEVAAHLGEVLWAMGDKQGAREIWKAALRGAPGDDRLLEVIQRLDP